MTESGRKGHCVEQLAGLLDRARNIVFLTGAGMSTESGIPDFRSPTGIYATVTSEEVFDIEAFRRDPSRFFEFGRHFFADMAAAEPNAGHRAIAALETRLAKEVEVVTQNIDCLHQLAGNRNVYALHGTTQTCTCTRCGVNRSQEAIWPIVRDGRIPRHDGCGGVFKPDIVFFGEQLPEVALFRSYTAIRGADLLVVAGTSLTVYPAAGLPASRQTNCPLVILNRAPTHLDGEATLVIRESIGDILSAALDCMEQKRENTQ